MCDQCDGYSERFRVDAGREHHNLIRQLLNLIHEGIFKLLPASVPLEEVLTRKSWSDELLVHVLACTKCGREFELRFDTHRDTTALWQPRISNGSWLIQ